MDNAEKKIKSPYIGTNMMSISKIERMLDVIPFGLRNKIRHMPVIKQIQSWVMKEYMDGKEFTATISGGPAKGLTFPVKLPQDKQMWIGTWELEFAEALKQCIEPGWICYDIGGYKGYYSGVMALKGAKEVYVFEPMPANANKIKNLIQLNPTLPIRLKEYAISDNCGKAVFKMMPEETMGKLHSSSFQQDDESISELTVDCITLDELIKFGLPEPDFIKIDVEGAEEFVLNGALSLLNGKKPFLMIEVHSPLIGRRCLEILENYYSRIRVFETGMTPHDPTPTICHYIAYY
jgi:FkbM family methyltransferase